MKYLSIALIALIGTILIPHDKQPETRYTPKTQMGTLTLVTSTTSAPNLPPKTYTTKTTASTVPQETFCQYPDRWSNPPGGCDNTDPAIPECLDYAYSQQAEMDCIKEYETVHNEN